MGEAGGGGHSSAGAAGCGIEGDSTGCPSFLYFCYGVSGCVAGAPFPLPRPRADRAALGRVHAVGTDPSIPNLPNHSGADEKAFESLSLLTGRNRLILLSVLCSFFKALQKCLEGGSVGGQPWSPVPCRALEGAEALRSPCPQAQPAALLVQTAVQGVRGGRGPGSVGSSSGAEWLGAWWALGVRSAVCPGAGSEASWKPGRGLWCLGSVHTAPVAAGPGGA